MTLFRLSLAWGRRVAEIEAELTPRELAEYVCYFEVEPWNKGFALVAQTIANANRGRGQQPYELARFMPRIPHRPVDILAAFKRAGKRATERKA